MTLYKLNDVRPSTVNLGGTDSVLLSPSAMAAPTFVQLDDPTSVQDAGFSIHHVLSIIPAYLQEQDISPCCLSLGQHYPRVIDHGQFTPILPACGSHQAVLVRTATGSLSESRAYISGRAHIPIARLSARRVGVHLQGAHPVRRSKRDIVSRPVLTEENRADDHARASLTLAETEQNLRTQYNDLAAQFHGKSTDATTSTLSHPNDPSLAEDFARASEQPQAASSSSLLKRSLRGTSNGPAVSSPKSVRFTDAPIVQEDEARNALFPYRDDPESGPPDQSHLDNQQIHEYHSQVLAEQDEQLDRLGESIGRQRDLSIQIGDELDEHVQMLDEVDGHVDRHQSTLDKARKSLGNVARKAKDNMSMTVIVILIIILVLLIVILK
jgi:syntaxin 8